MIDIFVIVLGVFVIFILGMFFGVIISMFIVSCKMYRRYYWKLEKPMLDWIKKNMEDK